MTEKQLFFTKLHGKLAKELKITSEQVSTLRSFVIGSAKDLEDIYKWAQTKLDQPRAHADIHRKIKTRLNRRRCSLVYYQQIMTFLDRVTKGEWELLTQKTEFDK